VIETKSLDEAFKLLIKQPVGARLHVFSPDLDNVGEVKCCEINFEIFKDQ